MNKTSTSEQKIRAYLLFLSSPESLIDSDRVAELESKASAATDPIEKLRLLAALRTARVPDGLGLAHDFVQTARQWAEENGIPPETFEELGVPADVLRAAGLSRRTPRNSASAPEARGKSVSVTDIQTGIAERLPATFTLSAVADTVGGSPMTIRKAVDQMVTTGTIKRLGPTPNWQGRGRAPIQFKKTGK